MAVIAFFDHKPSGMRRFVRDRCYRKVPALEAGGFDWIDVRDLVDGTPSAESRGRCGESYTLSGSRLSKYELGQIARAATGVRSPRLLFPMPVARACAPFPATRDRLSGRRPVYSQYALEALSGDNRCRWSAKSEIDLGFRSRPTAKSVADTYRWLAEQGYLDRDIQND